MHSCDVVHKWKPSQRLQTLMSRRGIKRSIVIRDTDLAYHWLCQHEALFDSVTQARHIITAIRYWFGEQQTIGALRTAVKDSYVYNGSIVGPFAYIRNIGPNRLETLRRVLFDA